MKASLVKEAVLDDYFSWLCYIVGIDQEDDRYWILMNALYNKEFRWSIPNDDNRASEGVNLRELFCDENGVSYDYDIFDGPCSMLELFIALAYRCEEIMIDQGDNMKMRDWFWKMISNVKLDKFTDQNIHDYQDEDEIYYILDRIIERKYKRDGRGGGLFPLKNTQKDQRKVELWYQMSTYLVENYYADEEVV